MGHLGELEQLILFAVIALVRSASAWRSSQSVPRAMAMASVLGGTVMLLVSLTACALPPLRALRIAPTDALRHES